MEHLNQWKLIIKKPKRYLKNINYFYKCTTIFRTNTRFVPIGFSLNIIIYFVSNCFVLPTKFQLQNCLTTFQYILLKKLISKWCLIVIITDIRVSSSLIRTKQVNFEGHFCYDTITLFKLLKYIWEHNNLLNVKRHTMIIKGTLFGHSGFSSQTSADTFLLYYYNTDNILYFTPRRETTALKHFGGIKSRQHVVVLSH